MQGKTELAGFKQPVRLHQVAWDLRRSTIVHALCRDAPQALFANVFSDAGQAEAEVSDFLE
jgi:hypothetical protein